MILTGLIPVVDGVATPTPITLLITAVGGLVAAVVWMYFDNKKDRKFYFEKIESVTKESTIASNGLNGSVAKLSDTLDKFRDDIHEHSNKLHELTITVERLDARLK